MGRGGARFLLVSGSRRGQWQGEKGGLEEKSEIRFFKCGRKQTKVAAPEGRESISAFGHQEATLSQLRLAGDRVRQL